MPFDLIEGVVLEFTSYEVVVLIEKPDGGNYFQALSVPRAKRPEMVCEGKSETAKPAILTDINQFVVVVLTDWKRQHHCCIEGKARFVVQQVNVTPKRWSPKKISNQLHSGVSISGAGLAKRAT